MCVAEYKVEPKRTPAAEPLPAPFFLPMVAKKRMTIERMPIERPTGVAQLQPLAEAAKSEEKGAALARATLAANVSTELAEKVDVLQVGLALRLAQHHIQLCEYECHWGTACMIAMLERAQLLYRFSGRVMSMSPPTRSLPEGLGKRDNETRTFFLHYPPPEAARSGFFAKSGHATTQTTFHVERAAQSALPNGVRYPFACQYDIFTDLFEAHCREKDSSRRSSASSKNSCCGDQRM